MATEKRDTKGKFVLGNSGRPKGSRNKYTDLKQSFLRVFNDLNPTEDCEHLMEWARECERPAGYLPPGPLAQTGDDRGLDR